MAEVFFDNPPILYGDEKSQLTQLQRYLNAMSDKLNQALMTISIEQMAPETQQVIRQASGEKAEERVASLKSMIIKTADVVRHEMDEITTRLEEHYTALSEQFGTYEEDFTQNVRETAQGVLREFDYDSRITNLEGETVEFMNDIRSYIYMGIIGYTDTVPAVPITGIAVGKGHITNDDGTINTSDQTATFTSEKLSFYEAGQEVAYFSGNVFHISKGEILQSLMMGNHTWKVLTGGALALVAG